MSATNNDLCGWLEQQGDKALLKTWRRRWFAQKGDYLYYFKSPDDKQPINYISLQRLEAPVKLVPNSNTRFELRVRSHASDDIAVAPPTGTAAQASAVTPGSVAAGSTTSASSSSSTAPSTTLAQSEFVLLRLRASTPEEALFWLAGLNDLLRQQAVAAKNAILSAHSTPVVTIKRDAVATRLTQAVVQSIGAPVAPEVVAAIQRELSVSLAERDTEVASARSESQLLLSELTDARRVIARLAESLGPAKAQQILGDASSSSSGGPANQPMPLTSDTLRRHNKDKPATLARGKPTVLSRRHDPLRVYDRSYVVALEKELLDTREELDDLKTAIDETEATINTLKTKFPHLQSANINLGSKLKTDDDGAADAELPPGAPNDDDDAASATLEAFVVWRATMAQDQQQFNAALQRPMPAVDSFAVADSSAPEFAAMPVPAADENDSDSDEQPPPPQDGDASMRFVPLSQMMARPVPSSPPAASPFDVIAPAKPKRSVNPPPTANAASASPEVGSPSSPRPTPPPPRAAQPTPTVPPKSPPVSPRVPRNNKPLPQLPPKSRTSTTQHPNAPASIDEDKTPSDRVEPSEDSDSVRVSQRQTKPLPEFNSTDLELARQAARKPLPVAGHSNSAAAAAAVAATMPSSPVSSAAAATALPVAKKPPMPTVARPALRVNLPTGAANVAVPGPASPGSPSKRAPPTLTLPALPGIPQGQPGVYDLVPTTSQMEAALVENAAIDALVPPTEYGKIPSFVDEQQQQQQENAETTEEIGADEVN